MHTDYFDNEYQNPIKINSDKIFEKYLCINSKINDFKND